MGQGQFEQIGDEEGNKVMPEQQCTQEVYADRWWE